MSAPYWRLKGGRCPCGCGGEGVLVFVTCPGCGHVALACDEVGTVFPAPRDLSVPPCGSWFAARGPNKNCPGCGKVPLSDYEHSSGEEIQRIGIMPSEYE